ncbi:MAG: hypothetical protein ACTHK8_15150 [Ginsengibacter sp.]
MKRIISESKAALALTVILSLLVIFHLLLLLNILPYKIVWGGRIENKSELLKFELISIFMNLIMILVVCIKEKYFRLKVHPKVIQTALWLMFAIFILNTIGNLLSVNRFEKLVFTPLTLILSLLSLRLAMSK